MKSKALIAALLLSLGAALASPLGAAEKISMAYLLGSSGAPPEVMKSLKLDEKYGIEIEYKPFQDIAAMDRAFVLGEIDINANLALNQWATFLNQGHDLVGVMGALHPVGFVVAPTKSSVKDIKDLLGKRVGVYGIHGTSTAILGVLIHEALPGTDIRKSMQLFNSTPPVLMTLINKGEVDAILNVAPFVPKMVHSGEYRVVLDTNGFWTKQTGQALPFAVLAVTRKTLQAKPKAIQAAVSAWREGVDVLRSKPELLNGYLTNARITTPEEQKTAQKMMIPHYMNTWTPKDVEMIKLYWARAIKSGFLNDKVSHEKWHTFEFAR
jgi:ABC-type nitrate/sulfonate/bicarbonate transport system substrate-binding protein